MAVTITLEGFERYLTTVVPEARAAAIRGLRSGAQYLKGVVVEEISRTRPHPPVNTGEMRNSVEVESVPDGAIVEVVAPHAKFMEHGTRPHFPPLAPLRLWARRQLGDERLAYPVARAISQRGIAPRRFFSRAVARALPVVRAEVIREISDAMRNP